jgi:quinolinate synthase
MSEEEPVGEVTRKFLLETINELRRRLSDQQVVVNTQCEELTKRNMKIVTLERQIESMHNAHRQQFKIVEETRQAQTTEIGRLHEQVTLLSAEKESMRQCALENIERLESKLRGFE